MLKKLVKNPFFLSVLVYTILASCNGQKNALTTIPSLPPKPISTALATSIPDLPSTPTQILPTELPVTPTFTPFPLYHPKNVVFEYYIVGQRSDFDVFYADCCRQPNMILYADGQMIVKGEQKALSDDEVKGFLSKLDTLGFFSLESNQRMDPTDKLYDFGENYQEVDDGIKKCIRVNNEKTKNLCVQEAYMQYLIPEMEAIFKYLDDYRPTGLTPYYPDRILLSVQPADSYDDLPATAASWDERFPSLEFSTPTISLYDNPPPIMYVEGNMAEDIYIFVESSNSHNLFIQDGKKYIIQIEVVLPHETVINAYQ